MQDIPFLSKSCVQLCFLIFDTSSGFSSEIDLGLLMQTRCVVETIMQVGKACVYAHHIAAFSTLTHRSDFNTQSILAFPGSLKDAVTVVENTHHAVNDTRFIADKSALCLLTAR